MFDKNKRIKSASAKIMVFTTLAELESVADYAIEVGNRFTVNRLPPYYRSHRALELLCPLHTDEKPNNDAMYCVILRNREITIKRKLLNAMDGTDMVVYALLIIASQVSDNDKVAIYQTIDALLANHEIPSNIGLESEMFHTAFNNVLKVIQMNNMDYNDYHELMRRTPYLDLPCRTIIKGMLIDVLTKQFGQLKPRQWNDIGVDFIAIDNQYKLLHSLNGQMAA